MICHRCGVDTKSHTMSMFNTDIICLECADDERAAPNYQKARAIENDAVLGKNYNFKGIGLAPDDEAFLAARREARQIKDGP